MTVDLLINRVCGVRVCAVDDPRSISKIKLPLGNEIRWHETSDFRVSDRAVEYTFANEMKERREEKVKIFAKLICSVENYETVKLLFNEVLKRSLSGIVKQ